jgi:hypothetical protein
MKICVSCNLQRDMRRYNTENVLLLIHIDALIIYCILDSVTHSATLNSPRFFCVFVATMVTCHRHHQF